MNKMVLSAALFTLVSATSQADNLPSPTTSVGASTSVPSQTVAPSQPTVVLDCHYHIPAANKQIEQSLISAWAEKAAVQSFDFNPENLVDQLGKLKACFTDPGWQGFNEALQKSGNLTAINSQHLAVSGQVEGTSKIDVVKENQWKVTIPMRVVYQNDKEKLTQLLSVDLMVGRKTSGDLGIMQIIATTTPATPEATQPRL